MQKTTFLLLALLFFGLSLPAQNTLSYYLKIGKENSPLVLDNQNKAKLSQLETERLKALYNKLQISLSANYLFAPIISTENGKTNFVGNAENATNYYGYDLAASNGGNYQGLINFNQPLFNGGKAYEQQAAINAELNSNTTKLSIHDLEKSITDQYIICLNDLHQIAFADSMVILLKDQTSIVNQLLESGLLKQSDLALVKIELQNYKAIKVNNSANYKRDLFDLKVLCGINDSSIVWLENSNLTLKSKSDTSNNGFLNKYTLDSLSALATQNVFEAKYKPQLNLIGNAGLNAVYAPTIPDRFGLSAGLSFSWNIFDGRQKPIVRQKTKIQLETVARYKSNFLIQNELRKTKILNELDSYDNRLNIIEEQLTEYQTLLKAYRREIMQGQLSIINYITTLKNSNTVNRDYIILKTNRLLLINQYNYWNW